MLIPVACVAAALRLKSQHEAKRWQQVQEENVSSITFLELNPLDTMSYSQGISNTV